MNSICVSVLLFVIPKFITTYGKNVVFAYFMFLEEKQHYNHFSYQQQEYVQCYGLNVSSSRIVPQKKKHEHFEWEKSLKRRLKSLTFDMGVY